MTALEPIRLWRTGWRMSYGIDRVAEGLGALLAVAVLFLITALQMGGDF